jgi:hypothetical protein
MNEAGGAGGEVEGRAIDHVVHVGRGSFRMTLPPAEPVMVARSLFDRRAEPPIPLQEQSADKLRGTVTVSWRLLGVAIAAVLASGTAATVAIFRTPPARVVAPAVSVPPPPPRPPVPAVVEPVVSVSPPLPSPPAVVPRTAVAPAPRPRAAQPRREAVTVPNEPKPRPRKPWVDPFAD